MSQIKSLNISKIREDFPILKRKVNGKPLIYLDSAASSQKPFQVIKTIDDFYSTYNANIHRAIHTLGEEATAAYEAARKKVAKFINAKLSQEIIFTRGTTESINLVASAWGRHNVKEGDLIVLTEMEHHSNIVPWQILAKEKKARIEYIRFDENGVLIKEDIRKLIDKNPKIVAVSHVSNVFGTINPIKEIVNFAHRNGTLVLVDGAQSVPHMPVDVQDLDADFYVFSGHKMLGPTGIGVLYGKKELLEKMEPYQSGGEMISEVHLQESKYKDIPYKFEAGTPNISGPIGLAAAVDYLESLGMKNVREHEKELVRYALEKLSKVEGLKIYGPKDPEIRGGVITFNFYNNGSLIHPHDVSQVLDSEGIAIRSGHHCAMPLHEKLNLPATCRASFYVYNTKEEIDQFVSALEKIRRFFS